MSVRLVEVTGSDPVQVEAWAAVTELSLRHEVGDAATAWAHQELLAVLRNPSSKRDEHFWAAYDGERLVGTAWLAVPLLDNLDGATIDVHVHPDLRRRGTGTLLLQQAESLARAAGRTLIDAEVQFAHGDPADGAGTPGREFLAAHGYAFGIANVQRSAPLPMPGEVLDALAAEAAPHHAAYRLESWAGPVPDELVEGWLAVASVLGTEAPTGDMEREPETVDVAAHRDDEALVAAQGRTCWRTAALTADGEVVAYTEIVVPDHDPRFVYQWGTLVRTDHRGHRLGVAVKVANHRALQEGADLGSRRVVTWNAEDNAPMIAINELMGFVPSARMAEMQKRLTP